MHESKRRRYHTKTYKLQILNEIDNCTISGGVGAIIRREGLYSSTISGWRKQKVEGKLDLTSTNSSDKIYNLEKKSKTEARTGTSTINN
jgi:transposase-like protein